MSRLAACSTRLPNLEIEGWIVAEFGVANEKRKGWAQHSDVQEHMSCANNRKRKAQREYYQYVTYMLETKCMRTYSLKTILVNCCSNRQCES